MNRIPLTFLLLLSALTTLTASAAIFDTLESVDTLKVIAAQKAQSADRMPAGKVTEATKDEAAGNVKIPDDERED